MRLIWTLIAAKMVFEGRTKSLLHDYAGTKAQEQFDSIASNRQQFFALANQADEFWSNEIRSQLRGMKTMDGCYWL
jgi:hypothetical protein